MGILRATATFTPRSDVGQFIAAKITPAAIAGAKAGAEITLEHAQDNVHVISGQLKASGEVVLHESEKTVVAEVRFTAPYAAIEEFRGTGEHAYLRPALDTTRDQIKRAFEESISLRLR